MTAPPEINKKNSSHYLSSIHNKKYNLLPLNPPTNVIDLQSCLNGIFASCSGRWLSYLWSRAIESLKIGEKKLSKLNIMEKNTNLIIISIGSNWSDNIISIITCSHYVDQSDNFVGMFSGGNKSLQDEYFKIFEHITALATHDLRRKKLK